MKKFALMTAVIALMANAAAAATLEFGQVNIRPVSPDEAAAGAPAGGEVYEFFINSTDNDVLSVNNVRIEGIDPFQLGAPFGSDSADNGPAFGDFNAAARADSFITTPGAGTAQSSPTNFTEPDASWFDTTTDPPITQPFLFARLTVGPGSMGNFSGRVSVTNGPGQVPDNFPFSYVIGIPEPTSMMLFGIGLVGLGITRRRS